MWIVAIAWIYVVGLMAVTEPSIVAGVMTFVGYCAIPLSILFYITGGKRRRARRDAQAGPNDTTGGPASEKDNLKDRNSDHDGGSDGGGDGGGGD